MGLIAPPPKLTVSEWADKHRYISPEVSGHPGWWKTNLVPHTREIMDSYNDPRIMEIVVMKAARMAITECINNMIGYCIDYDPSSMLYVQQSLEEGKKYSTSILKYLIEDTPVIHAKVQEEKAKDGSITIMKKTFPGGNLDITGANSPKGFRMVNKRIVMLDDIDGFEKNVGSEGDPVDLAVKRAATVPNRKIVKVSSPTIKEFSRIESDFLASDKRYYHVPCPFCDHGQTLKFGGKDKDYGLKWIGDDPETVYYICEQCHNKIKNYQKAQMLTAGKWIATAAFRRSAGFHISQLYSNFIPWADIIAEWLKAHVSPYQLQVFINTVIGETWEDKSEKVEDNILMARREDYGPVIPLSSGVLTAGVDIQDDRIEITVDAWGKGEECWNIDHKIFYGNTARPEIWDDLNEFLIAPYQHESDKLIWIAAAFIDSGHRTKQVYSFVRKKQLRKLSKGFIQRVIAVKGSSKYGDPIISKQASKRSKKTVNLYMVGTDTAKDTIYAYLKIDEQGPGYQHYTFDRDEKYFKQLTSEKAFMEVDRNGKKKRVWKVKQGARNEALDCKVYSYAALQHLIINLNMNLDKVCEKYIEHYELNQGEDEKEIKPKPEKKKPTGRRVLSKGIGGSGKGFVNRW